MPTIETLRQALAIAEQIEKLESELSALLQGAPASVVKSEIPAVASPKAPSKRRGKKKRHTSPEVRAQRSAMMKARWAAKRAAASKVK